MNKAVFLDRDGVLNHELGDYVTQFSDFKILPHVVEGLLELKRAGYLLIVITNQGGIAKGLYSVEELNKMHTYMNAYLDEQGASLTAIYYCPHHPDYGSCLCRKPGSLLVEKAIGKYDIDPAQSWFIGDKKRDIEAGNAVGVRGILIEPNADWTLQLSLLKNESNA